VSNVVIVEAVRTPIGRRRGGLSHTHPALMLGHALKAVVERSGVDPVRVGQVLGGCVTQVGRR
jgi:acetyl-CoA C-acetyltransferase